MGIPTTPNIIQTAKQIVKAKVVMKSTGRFPVPGIAVPRRGGSSAGAPKAFSPGRGDAGSENEQQDHDNHADDGAGGPDVGPVPSLVLLDGNGVHGVRALRIRTVGLVVYLLHRRVKRRIVGGGAGLCRRHLAHCLPSTGSAGE